jgi:uncharacterized protein DUF5703
MVRLLATAALLLLASSPCLAGERRAPAELDRYDVVWTTPSRDASGSMPIGNGEVGANVWVDGDAGELCFYVSRTDSFSEASRLLKLGKVRVRIAPNPFAGAGPPSFEQRLHLATGAIEVKAGAGETALELRLFVDAEAEVIHVTGRSARAVTATVVAESWRTADRVLKGDELASSWTMQNAPAGIDVRESADHLLPAGLCHRNESSVVDLTLRHQGLAEAEGRFDPLIHRTFGLLLDGPSFTRDASAAKPTLVQANARSFCVHVAAPCLQCEQEQGWRDAATRLLQRADSDAAFARTAAWWDGFWARSFILVDGDPSATLAVPASDAARERPTDPEPPSRLTRALLLQRWVQACGGRGDLPIKFNGSIFTVEPKYTGGPDFDADWRKWGDCFWWQNTRLPYHPMLAQGDFEMMAPLFRLCERVLPLCRARAKLYHGAEGAYFPETMTLFGTYANQDYGWDRTGHAPRDVLCPWWQYAWNQGPELVALMLDRYDYSPDPAFAHDHLIPMARAVLEYFESRFPRDPDEKIRLTPTQAVETYWHGVENDMPSVAGLHNVLPRLLALPDDLCGGELRERWRKLAASLPPIPTREADGVRMLAPAERYVDRRSNIETPELYAVFPFRLFGLGRKEIDLARAAYVQRVDKATRGWTQDGEFAALLGLKDEAQQNLLDKVRNANPRFRFPVMWGPNFDWLPDQDHGANLLEVAQLMVLQPAGEKLYVLPCWPASWNVSFRLHAPRDTLVEGEWRDGAMRRLVVTPPRRQADVVIGPPR